MAILMKNELLFAAVESTANTPQAITATNYVRAMDVSFAPEGLTRIDRSGVASGSQGAYKGLYGGSLQAITATCEFAPGAGAETTPEHDALLRAAGFAVADISNYDPITDNPSTTTGDATQYSLQSGVDTDTVTLAYAQDGIRRTIKGARASSLSFDFTTGQTARFSTTLIGHEDTATDTALPAFTSSTVDPFVVKNAELVIGGVGTFIVEAVTIDMGLDIQMLRDVRDLEGYAIPRIVNRAITVTIAPEKVRYATRNWWADLKADTPIALSFGIGQSRIADSNNEGDINIAMPQLVLSNVTDGDRSGIRTDELSFEAFKTGGGNNELQISFS